MAKKKRNNSAHVNNYLQLLFVLVAFAAMVITAYLFIGSIVQSHLLRGAQELLRSSEANVRAGLSEAEMALLNSHYVVQGMLENDVPHEEILEYLTITTQWMQQLGTGLFDFYGIYGFIQGQFFDSIGLNPGPDYIPQTRPWYQTAVRSGINVGYTSPYRDTRTGDTIITAVRNVVVNNEIVGILAVDINVNWLLEYVGSLSLASGGYGILLSQNLTFMAHPDIDFLGSQFQELGAVYGEIARILRSGENVTAMRIMDPNLGSVIVFCNRIFNNWFVGLITPYSQYNHDLNISAQILIVLGIIFSLALCFLLMRLSTAKLKADEENKFKSSFLASMSHEMRTPMNAITGMAELALREEMSAAARENVLTIRQAGNNLLSIINDILDFSKIEAGKLEIVPGKYMLSSLVNDALSIVRTRLTEKPIRFYANIDSKLPNFLFGDEVRLRQILLNLLSNAIKYTDKGHIGLCITSNRREENKIWLKFEIHDSGKGIKPEDQLSLFGDFVQVDSDKNRGIEGTGLGLAITKRLCMAMDGDISLESEYGKGSIFTVCIPQSIEDETPFAYVEDAEDKKVLVYEGRKVYSDSVCWTLDNLAVSYTLVDNQDELGRALDEGGFNYILSAYDLYDKIKFVLDNKNLSEDKTPLLALMLEWGRDVFMPNANFLPLPAQSLSISNILNGKTNDMGYISDFYGSGEVRFIIPEAKILVVDDIETNLKVAEGLLSIYKAEVETCLSGMEAIELVGKNNYDIVFMDHMMPDMDGIEATSAIRSLEEGQSKKNIIIALTANAIVGMKEIFISEGFDDFLAKPIDVSKLDDILCTWIPESKIKKLSEQVNTQAKTDAQPKSLIIPGLDVQRGIKMTGGTESSYRQILEIFVKDAKDRLVILKNTPLLQEEAGVFITHVHALKSASSSIGAEEVSGLAALLEAAGKNGDMDYIKNNLENFTQLLGNLVNNICDAIVSDVNSIEVNNNEKIGSASIPSTLLSEFASALEIKKINEIDSILDALMNLNLEANVLKVLEKISDEVLMAEYEKASELLVSLLKETDN